jgi:hypothetical protein
MTSNPPDTPVTYTAYPRLRWVCCQICGGKECPHAVDEGAACEAEIPPEQPRKDV